MKTRFASSSVAWPMGTSRRWPLLYDGWAERVHTLALWILKDRR